MTTSIPSSDWLEAATRGDLKTLQAWRASGALNPAAFKRLASLCRVDKRNALQLAITHGHEEYAQALIKLGRWPDSMIANTGTTLSLAVDKGLPDVVQALIDMGHSMKKRPRQENSPLDIACIKGNGVVGQVLVENGANELEYASLCQLVYLATRRSNLLDQGVRIYPGEEIKFLERLLENGVNPNWTGEGVPRETCLERWCAVVEEPENANDFQVEVLRILLKNGADTEQKFDMGAKGHHLPGTTWMAWKTDLQDFLRAQKALVVQQNLLQAVDMPSSDVAGPKKRF